MTLADAWLDQDAGSTSGLSVNAPVVGVVTNNQDPEQRGRVKLKFPCWGGDDESDWARIAVPMAGKQRGMFFLPEVDDEVLVAFAHGDVRLPYVIGSLWNGQDSPPEQNADGKNNVRVIKSRSGHVILFDDSEGKEKIEIKAKSGHAVVIDKTSVRICDSKEKIIIKLDADSGTVSINASKDITLTATNGAIKLDALQIEINGKASADLKSDGSLGIKGSLVKIN
jgi:uncharacterized protein involved in type VI secretion and phage assembly